MRLGDIANEAAADQPKPLAGIRVLAIEQMAALPRDPAPCPVGCRRGEGRVTRHR